MESVKNKIQKRRNYNIYADNFSIVKDRHESLIENKNVWKRSLRYLSFPYIELIKSLLAIDEHAINSNIGDRK
ncbi:hypothetical protein A9G17_01605 [Gilliamella sp. wkB7]|uniref:hypothetical protein n=1 Tax=Gilliamella sp. wkB7 TaxID=3120264 RepID=UPI000810CEEE|nr:hypothetical protein [Gilliamella apicola]OCF91899.1 hypothetical protein A9G17_01605 [Gilliamella apicola]